VTHITEVTAIGFGQVHHRCKGEPLYPEREPLGQLSGRFRLIAPT
jgi:hypothetical protein